MGLQLSESVGTIVMRVLRDRTQHSGLLGRQCFDSERATIMASEGTLTICSRQMPKHDAV